MPIGTGRLRFALVTLVLGAIFLLSLNAIGEEFSDTGYHLKTGEYVWTERAVPREDIFSFSAAGTRWIAHYWLFDVIIFWWHRLFGMAGVMAGSAVMAVLTYWVVLETVRLKRRSMFLPLVAVIPYSYLTYELWVGRPQIFSYFFTALLLFFLERWRTSRNPTNLFVLPPLFMIWSNFHGGAVLGLAIVSVYFFDFLLAFRPGASLRPFYQGVALFAASFGAVLLNPNGFDLLTYSFRISSAVKDLGVLEWRSLLAFPDLWQARAFFVLASASLFAVLWGIIERRGWRGLVSVEAALIGGAFFLPLISIRHVGFFPIIAFPLVVAEVSAWIEPNRSGRFESKKAYIAAFMTLSGLVGYLAVERSRQPEVLPSLMPVRAVEFIESSGIQGNMFNTPYFGGYLIWKLWPREKVFIDGRSEVYANKVGRDYLTIMRQEAGWERLARETYDFNYFILWYREPLAAETHALIDALVGDLGYSLVWWDDTAVVLLRDTPENRETIERHGYRVIRPSLAPEAIRREHVSMALEETMRAIARSPDSKLLRAYAERIRSRIENNSRP